MNAETPGRLTPRRARWLIGGGIALAAVIVALGVGLSLAPGPRVKDVASGPDPTATNGAVPGPAASAPPTNSPLGPTPTPTPGKRASAEVENPGASARALPPSKPQAPLFTGPMPKTASAAGSLVEGFPEVIPVAKRSSISTSSVASSGRTLQATLVAKTASNSTDLIGYYTTALAKVGLSANPLPSVGGSTGLSFARGSDSITLTVTPTSSGSSYSVYGVLSAAP
jgi:hypothetical protein